MHRRKVNFARWVVGLLGLVFLATPSVLAQSLRGRVVDQVSQQPLIGATVRVVEGQSIKGTVTGVDGTYQMDELAPGRYSFEVEYLGYTPVQRVGVMISANRESTLDFELAESSVVMDEVVVRAVQSPHQPGNEAAVLSARSFSVEEVQHYAGAINDPGRMAHSLPGVQPSKDNEGDIIVRGNSSQGIVWRLEGVDILNPNHFARLGGSGGGLSIFSINLLSTSDFISGAFPADYGNGLSAVFDMRFRNGSTTRRQHRFRAGMLGLELATEGPFKTRDERPNKASYLVNYRYSTLGILNEFGIYLVGDRVRNNFQDLSLNLYFPGKDQTSSWRIWATGGLSAEAQVVESGQWNVFNDSLSYDTGSDVGMVGVTHVRSLGGKSHFKSTLAYMAQRAFLAQYRNFSIGQNALIQDEDYRQGKLAWSTSVSSKLSAKSELKYGLQLAHMRSELLYDSLVGRAGYRYLDATTSFIQAQPFARWSYRIHEKADINAGVHAFYFGLTQDLSVEPRISLSVAASAQHRLALSAGLHSQSVPIGIYFEEINGSQPNRDLSLMKAVHLGLAHDWQWSSTWSLHSEVYYQRLSDIPAYSRGGVGLYLLNEVEGYPVRPFESVGSGENYGLEISIERYFRSGFFFLLNGSVSSSTYTIPGFEKTSTQFNAGAMASLTLAKEWTLGRGLLQVGSKSIFVRGLPATPLAQTQVYAERPTLDDSRPYSERIDDYFRSDMRLAWRKGSHLLSLDVQNIFNVKNTRSFGWEQGIDGQWQRRQQAGLVPVLSYQLDF